MPTTTYHNTGGMKRSYSRLVVKENAHSVIARVFSRDVESNGVVLNPEQAAHLGRRLIAWAATFKADLPLIEESAE